MPALATAARGVRRHLWALAVVALALTLLGNFVYRGTQQGGVSAAATPQNGTMEAALGVRFTRIDVVGGGGIIELRYVVLDTEKAGRFQGDVYHPPLLQDEGTNQPISQRTALMKQGHELRPGQEYYILYLNNRSDLRPGDTVQIQAGDDRLAHFPVS